MHLYSHIIERGIECLCTWLTHQISIERGIEWLCTWLTQQISIERGIDSIVIIIIYSICIALYNALL